MKYWYGWYLLGIAAIIGLTVMFRPLMGHVAGSIVAGVLGGAWGFGWSRALARRRRAGPVAWGSRLPRYNGRGEPCDMWTGPCSCGATHVEGK